MSNRILIVDDEPAVIDSLTLILKEKDYDVAAAYDGEEAIIKLRSHDPNLIILDIMLPKMQGHEVHKAIRAEEGHKNTPVIMLSASEDFEDMKNNMDTGATAYVTKPFDYKVLLGIIKGILEK